MNLAQQWYLAFGYLDDYWREIEETNARSNSSWSDADTLEHACRVFSVTGCANLRRAIAYAEKSGLTELWDIRGAPDRCNNDSGE